VRVFLAGNVEDAGKNIGRAEEKKKDKKKGLLTLVVNYFGK